VRLVTVKVPEIYLEGIDELVKLGRYSSRSEVIRTAIRDLLRRELWVNKVTASDIIATHDFELPGKKVFIRKIKIV